MTLLCKNGLPQFILLLKQSFFLGGIHRILETDASGAFEEHVLQKVGGTDDTGYLIHTAHAKSNAGHEYWRMASFHQQYRKAVGKNLLLNGNLNLPMELS